MTAGAECLRRATMRSKEIFARALLSFVEYMARYSPAPMGIFFAIIHYSHLRTGKRISQNGSDQAGRRCRATGS